MGIMENAADMDMAAAGITAGKKDGGLTPCLETAV